MEREDLEIDEAGGGGTAAVRGGVGVGVAAVILTGFDFDGEAVFAHRTVIFFDAAQGVTKLEKQAFASHLKDAQAGAAGCNFKVAAEIAARVDDFEVVIEEGSGRSELADNFAIEFLLDFDEIGDQVHGASRAHAGGLDTIGPTA